MGMKKLNLPISYWFFILIIIIVLFILIPHRVQNKLEYKTIYQVEQQNMASTISLMSEDGWKCEKITTDEEIGFNMVFRRLKGNLYSYLSRRRIKREK